MRRRHPNGTGSGPAAWQQGKGRRHHQRRRGLGVRHLLRLLVLLAAQQGGAMVDGSILGRFILQPAAVAGGFLLAPQAAQAQCASLSTPTITVTPGNKQLTVSWSALSTGQSSVDYWILTYRKPGASNWQSVNISNASARSYRITTLQDGSTPLEDGTTYEVGLRASPSVASGCSPSSWSTTVTATTTAATGVTISAETLTVTAGASKTYTVVLDSDPGAQVVVTPTSSPVAKATVSGALTFTTATNNWSTAQTVTVTGVAAGTATISHTVTGYTGVQNSDIEDVDVTVNAASTGAAPVLTTATSTTSGEIDLTWTHAGSSGRDFFPANLPPAAQFSHWEVSHRLKGATSWMGWGSSTLSSGTSLRTVAASLANAYPDGAVVEVRVNAVATLTSGSTSYPISGPQSNTRTVTYKNDDLDALTFTGNPVTVAVNDTATYTVKLTKAYGGVVSVTSDDTDKATVSPAALTFTTSTYNTAQTVTVTGVATGGSPKINHSFRLTGATADAIPDAGSVSVTVGAAATKTITLSADSTTITEGNSGRKDVTITVALSEGAPRNSFPVRFSLDAASTGKATTDPLSSKCTSPVPADADMCWSQFVGSFGAPSFVASNLIFSSGATTGTLKIGILGDTTDENDETLKLRATAEGYTAGTLTLTITDDDGTPAAPTGFLAAPGNGEVTLSWDDPEDASITGYQYQQKTSGDWGTTWTTITSSSASTTSHPVTGLTNGTAYTFRLRAVNAAGNGAVSLERTVAPTDKTITLSAAPASITEGNAGRKDVVVTATLSEAAPSGGVSITLTSDPTSRGTAQGATSSCAPSLNPADADWCAVAGFLTIAEGSQTGTKTYRILGDTRDESDETIKLLGYANGWVSGRVTITITDDDGASPGVTISADTLTVDAGASKTYTVVLDSDPGAQVVVTPTSTPAAKATVSGALTFTTATNNWSTAQTVTVTGVAAGTATISHAITGYSGVTASDIEDVDVTVEATATAPAAPTGFSATAGDARVVLSWEDPENDDITGYEVRYGKKNVRRRAPWAAISGSDADTVTHTVTGLDNNAEYSFKVRAVSSAGDGAATDWEDATPVAPVVIKPPTGLTIVPGPDRLYLSWTAPTDANRTGWRVQYREWVGPNWGDWSSWTAITGAAATSYTLTGLSGTTGHQVALTATGASNAVSTAATSRTVNTAAGVSQSTNSGSFLGVNEGSTKTYRIKLLSRGTGDVTVTPSSANTALSFSPTALTFTTANWNTNKTLTVTAAADENTDNETATISYGVSGGNYPAITQTLSVRITDTTPTLQLSTDPSAVSEGTPISLTVTSDRTLIGPLPVRLTLAARGSSGFTAADIPGTLGPRNFNADFGSSPGGTTGTVSIPTSTDADATEGAEAYRITLSDAAGYAVGTDVTADGVLNDGTAATVSVPATRTVAEGVSTSKAVVTITTPRAFGASTTFNVSYGNTSSTADTDARGRGNPSSSNNGDYDNNNVTSVTFSATEKTKAIEIPIRNDKLDEEDETFTVTIAAAAALPDGFSLGNATTVVTITDDDNTPVLAAIEDVNLKQGQAVDITASASDADGDTVTYTWSRKGGESSPAIPGGTGLAAARLNFTPPGTGTYTMTVTASDGANEATEEVIITVTNANVVQVPERVAVAEGAGNAVVRITTAEAFGQAVTFNVSYGSTSVTSDTDATGAANPASGDYDNDAVTSVTFNSTETTKDIVIPVTDDDLDEENETFEVTIAAAATLPSGFQLARATTVVTITDDDNTPVLQSIEDVTLKQGQAVDITAAATDADGDTVTYTWSRKSGESSPAIPGGTGLNAARLNFTPPGTGTYTMTVTASDGTNEATEEVRITVTNANVVQVPERVAVGEGDGNAVVRITTTEAFGQAVTFTVTYGSTSVATDNDATGASDPASGDYDNDAVTAVTFAAADTSKEIRIPITDDQTVEGEETFTVTIAPAAALPGGFQLARATTVVTITDNDTPSPGGSGGGGGNNPSAPTTPSIAAPAQPSGLTAKAGNAQVALSWNNPDNATITKWQVQQKQGDGSYGPWVDIPNSTATTTSYTVTGLTNGMAYSLRIRAVNAGGNSPASAEVRATPMAPPLKPTGVTATAGHGQVTLSWDNPDNATITRWQVQQKEGSGSYGAWRDIPNSTASTTSHTVTGLTNGVSYSFRIRAVNAGGNGAPSDEVTATPIDQDVVQADKARSQALAATSRTLLGMATDMLGSRSGGDAPVALAGAGGSMGEQAMGIVENLLGINGSELPTSLTLEDVEDRLWSQSFQLTPPAKGSDGQQEWNPLSPQQRSWALWGAGELRSYRGNDDTEHLSYSGNVKTAWLGIDHQFTDRWMAGAALSFATGQSDYSYRKTDGSKDGGKMESRLTVVYPYGSFQVSEGLRLWGMAGMGWGSQHHQQTGDHTKAEGDLRLQMGVVGFERSLSSIGELSLSLAGDAGLVKSTTDWKAGSGLDDLDVSLHRIRLGIDSSFPLTAHTTGYLNLKGRLDGGDLEMNAAEIVAGLHYSKERFSGFLQGRQTYAFDGSYAESALTAQLRLTANTDGTRPGLDPPTLLRRR